MKQTSISELRKKIDRVDNRIVNLIHERMALIVTIGRMKKMSSKPIYNRQREKEVINNWLDQAAKHGLDRKIINSIARLIIRASIIKQKNNE